jgi:sugar O-acyltransferase (sialic acid O-acetyltransferase NeuD family)
VTGRLVGLGAGGHAKVVIEILRAAGGWDIVGLLDRDPDLWGKQVLGVTVLGGDDLLSGLPERGIEGVFLGVGMVGEVGRRVRLFDAVCAAQLCLVAAVHPAATVSPTASLGHGPTVMAGAVVNADTRLGSDVIVNSGAVVEHDCLLGDHVHVAPGALLASGVRVGDCSHIGLGARVIQGVRIGREVMVAAGAVVIHDLPDGARVAGVPARQMAARVQR